VADIAAAVAVDLARVVKDKPSEAHPHLVRWRAAMGHRAAVGLSKRRNGNPFAMEG
jgi:glutathione S-transferase